MAFARPFAYNPGTSIPGTEQVGSLAIGAPTSGFTNNPQFWNGPDEDLGYVIAAPVSGDTQPTPLSLTWDPNYAGTGIVLSSGNTVATSGQIQSSVLGTRLITSPNKVMYSIRVNQLVTGQIGFGLQDMDLNSYVGGIDAKSIGFSSDGDYLHAGTVQDSGLPTWGSVNDVVDIALDLNTGIWWIRVNGGNWNGTRNEDPSSGTGSVNSAGLNNLYPAITPFPVNIQGQVTLLSQPIYSVPAGFTFLGDITASVGFYGTSGFSDSEFINLSQSVSSTYGTPQTFSSATDASVWLTTNGFWNSYVSVTPTPTGTLSVTSTPTTTSTPTVTPTGTSVTPTPTATCTPFINNIVISNGSYTATNGTYIRNSASDAFTQVSGTGSIFFGGDAWYLNAGVFGNVARNTSTLGTGTWVPWAPGNSSGIIADYSYYSCVTPTPTPTTTSTPTPSVTNTQTPTNTETPTNTPTPTSTDLSSITTYSISGCTNLNVLVVDLGPGLIVLGDVNYYTFTGATPSGCYSVISKINAPIDDAFTTSFGTGGCNDCESTYTTPTPTPTNTETPTNTPTETLTSTPTETLTSTPTETLTSTPTETPTSTPTPSVTNTQTPSVTSTNTETPTPTPTLTQTPTPTSAATPTGFSVTIVESGGNVVMSASGSLNINDLTLVNPSAGPFGFGGLGVSTATFLMGTNGINAAQYSGFTTTPPNFGPGGVGGSQTSVSGNIFGVIKQGPTAPYSLLVPVGYTTGTAISSTQTFSGQTFSSFGLTPGTYTYTWGSGANADSINVVVS